MNEILLKKSIKTILLINIINYSCVGTNVNCKMNPSIEIGENVQQNLNGLYNREINNSKNEKKTTINKTYKPESKIGNFKLYCSSSQSEKKNYNKLIRNYYDNNFKYNNTGPYPIINYFLRKQRKNNIFLTIELYEIICRFSMLYSQEIIEILDNQIYTNTFFLQFWIPYHYFDEAFSVKHSTFMFTDFSKKNLTKTHFINCNFYKSNFDSVILKNAIFENCNLSFVDFENTTIKDTNFYKCTIKGANFKNTIFGKAKFSFSNLEESKFENVDLIKVQFTSSDLLNTTCTKSKLHTAIIITTKNFNISKWVNNTNKYVNTRYFQTLE